jgi:hypothetical protein
MYKLRQLVGKRANNGVIEEVAQPIDEVLVSNASKTCGWERLGFVSRHDGAHISFKAGLSEGDKQAAHSAVTKMRSEAYKFATAGKFVSTMELPSEVTSEAVEVDDE